MSRRVLGIGALVLCLAASLNAAGAQTPQRPVIGLEISPSRLEVDLEKPRFQVRIALINHEDGPRRILLSVSGLGHTLDGAPLFPEDDPVIDHLTVSEPHEFVLEREARREVLVEGEVPPGKRGVYAALIARFEPLDPETGAVDVRTRVASLFLLRGLRPWKETVEVVDVGVVPPAEGQNENVPLTVFAAAQNTGNVHVKPFGEVDILKAESCSTRSSSRARRSCPASHDASRGAGPPTGS